MLQLFSKLAKIYRTAGKFSIINEINKGKIIRNKNIKFRNVRNKKMPEIKLKLSNQFGM